MWPTLFGPATYLAAWAVAAAVGVSYGIWRAQRAGFAALPSFAALASTAALLVIGSKALYLLESALFPFDDYVPPPLRGWVHGFRIPGGVALLALAGPVLCRAFRLPWRAFGDATIGALPLALICIRLGCLLNGCCFGAPTSLPWSIEFRRGSWAHYSQASHGLISPDAATSLPVHPLQLYFIVAAALALAWSLRRRPARPGMMQGEIYLLFFASTAVIEPFRGNALTLNTLLLLFASLIAGATVLHLDRVGSRLSPPAASQVTLVTAERKPS